MFIFLALSAGRARFRLGHVSYRRLRGDSSTIFRRSKGRACGRISETATGESSSPTCARVPEWTQLGAARASESRTLDGRRSRCGRGDGETDFRNIRMGHFGNDTGWPWALAQSIVAENLGDLAGSSSPYCMSPQDPHLLQRPTELKWHRRSPPSVLQASRYFA
jgi:hypothetical protein